MSEHTHQKLLVTGGAGFIGSNFIQFVLQQYQGVSVTNLDLLTYSGNLKNLTSIENDDRYKFVQGDICDRDLVQKLLLQCDAVVHFAAESHVDRSIDDALPFLSTNINGTQVLLEACRATQKNIRMLYVSTDEVYGSLDLEPTNIRFQESSPIAPNSPYAASKAAGDLLVRAAHHTYGMDVVTTRCSNNFGPYQYPEKVIPLFVTNLIQNRKVPLYGDGLNVRDWIHVIDHCEAIWEVLQRGSSGEVYNVGGNNERSNIELTHGILDALGCSHNMIHYVEDRLGHDRRYAIDGSKIQKELGWAPSRSNWPMALESTIKWYSDNQSWWEPLLKQ